MSLKYMYITNRPEVAKIAQAAGVDRIWIDLETNGKAQRQAALDSVKSHHKLEDILSVKNVLNSSKLLVRVNSLYSDSEREIVSAIEYGANIIMLPMYKTWQEAEKFVKIVNGKAQVCLLLETKEAELDIENTLKVDGIDEIHIGLNDLHLAHHMRFMFELLQDGTIEKLCEKISKHDIPYGFGGIARLKCGLIPAELIIAEHYRLGSSMAILSRSFCNCDLYKDLNELKNVFCENIANLREYENMLKIQTPEFFIKNKSELNKKIEQTVAEFQR